MEKVTISLIPFIRITKCTSAFLQAGQGRMVDNTDTVTIQKTHSTQAVFLPMPGGMHRGLYSIQSQINSKEHSSSRKNKFVLLKSNLHTHSLCLHTHSLTNIVLVMYENAYSVYLKTQWCVLFESSSTRACKLSRERVVSGVGRKRPNRP